MPPRQKKRTYSRRTSKYARRSPKYTRRSSVRRTSNAKKSKCRCVGELTPGAKFAMAQIDPFDSVCMGAKIPDSNTMPSLSTLDVENVAMRVPTATANCEAIAFRPQYKWGTIQGKGTAGGSVVDWGTTFATNAIDRTKAATYASSIELTRPVSHGVRLSCPLAPTTVTGFVHIALANEAIVPGTTWEYPTTLADIAGMAYYRRITLASLTQSPLTIVNKWLDDTAFRYSNPVGVVSNPGTAGAAYLHTDYGWATIIVIVEGAPAGVSSLSAEHLLLSEGLPQKTAFLVGTSAAPNSPGTLAAVSTMVQEQEFTHTESEQAGTVQRGLNSLAQGAATAGEHVFTSVAQPLLQRLGAAATYAAAGAAMRYGMPGINNEHRLAY